MGPDLLVRQHIQAICWQIHLWSGSWYVELISVCPSLSDTVSCWGYIASVTEEWIWGTGRIILTGENRRTRRHACPSANLSTTNPTWTGPWSNPVTAVRSWQLTIQPVKLMRFEVSLQKFQKNLLSPASGCQRGQRRYEWSTHGKPWIMTRKTESDCSSYGLLYTLCEGNGENCIMSLVICTPYPILCGR